MKLKYIFYLAACCLLVTSCAKDFLNQKPNVIISDAEYWKSTNDLKLYTNNYYNTMFPPYSDYFQVGVYGDDADMGSDNMVKLPYNSALNGETVVPASGGGWDWTKLRTLNYFMDNYHKVNDSWDNLKPYVGETLFLRAMFYFDMLKKFGPLPWINKALNSDDKKLYGARLPRNIVADSILADLDHAIAYLPSRNGSQVGRINKEVAMLLQSRVALYEGTWEKYHSGTPFGVTGANGNDFLKKAADAAGTLIDNEAGFTLDNVGVADGYRKLFNQTDYSNSNEVMFWRKFDNSLGIYQHWYLFVPLGLDRGITKNLVDDYLCADGKPIGVSPLYQGDDSLQQVVKNRDPRLRQTIFTNGAVITSNRAGGAPDVIFTKPDFANSANAPTGYELLKGNISDASQQVENSTQALIYFRFAEALLNFAEAKAELGILTQGDADKSINKLRGRVGMPSLNISGIVNDPDWTFPDLSPVINEVRRERRIELACEGFRHDDIFRWAAAKTLIAGWQPKGAKLKQWATLFPAAVLSKYTVDSKGYILPFGKVPALTNGYKFNNNRDYLLPLPSDQLVLNPALGGNNPGW
ncbi:RagB/SusD family nutrient uptake outer membrane protein [Mucilaginibacter sabulilitoris]|uniref:RagB/SusD family nutrient uptake outer membrane protein n=1 Tax=Mucilaginibacter sabulilitoris TaxID=1173583 RepID=A0ABZ0TK93_9SPHI|nr:RagB/SusD family nutrient uptake outer membrane protein [Mucilaginibacter sabulilitoris]WPU92842.1 RagB/SusD family nutrient uptake outer membrane protein [Mucilaginibacter sabulilitoris]